MVSIILNNDMEVVASFSGHLDEAIDWLHAMMHSLQYKYIHIVAPHAPSMSWKHSGYGFFAL